MIEKIEKVLRVKSVDNDVGRRFDSRRKKDDDGDSSFANALRRVMNKKEEEKSVEVPDAYKLELSSLNSQSLFYFGGLNFRELLS